MKKQHSAATGIVLVAAMMFASASNLVANDPSAKSNIPETPAGLIFEKDVRYRNGHERWLLNVIHPKQASSKPRPAIVLVHGGGWTGGDHDRFSKMGFMLAQRGYVVILPTYRMIKDGPFPACLHDVKNSIRWLRANAQKYNVDPKRIGAYGNSAGGTLALTVAMTAGDKELEGKGTHLEASSALQAVVCSGAVGDMLHPDHSKRAAAVYRNLAGALNRETAESEIRKVMRRASPSSYIRKDVPPVLLIHGAKDTVVFIDSTDDFHKRMKSAGAIIEYLRFDDGTHGVMGQNARTTTPAMVRFFDTHLGPKDAAQAATASVPTPFASGGKFKMLYDARQRPQSVYVKGRLFIVYNGDAQPSNSGKGRAYPMLISYDPANPAFSSPIRLGTKNSTDHHFSPIIWADEEDFLHVLHGCHKTPGTHLISRQPVEKGVSGIAWEEAPQIAPKLSYPTVFRIAGNRELIYYRTDGHTSSWTYRISEDNGRTWVGPDNDVTDLDSKGRLDWSSYQTKLPGKDGRHLHVVYTDYDDNKNSPDPQRFFNPRYKTLVSNEWKYNLSYVKINLENNEVCNADGRVLKTPIDIDDSKTHCEIWDTEWRGAGVPPAVALDENGNPAFLHVLSEDSLSNHQYYYVRRVAGEWKQTPITHSNHQWNSGHLSRDADGMLHAYVIAGESYLEGGYMDRHGGGRVEEWISTDKGNHWAKRREVSPKSKQYAGWRFNNVQPVVRPDGSTVNGMLLYYGWKDKENPEATAFLIHEET